MFGVNDRKESIHKTGLSTSCFNLQPQWCNPSHLTSGVCKADTRLKLVICSSFLVKEEMQALLRWNSPKPLVVV